MSAALAGINVLDFTLRLPGPLAGLMLARAGAGVVKVEPPEGDPLAWAMPGWGDAPATYELLNRGKRVVRLDLKKPAERAELEPLLERCDVLLEGFRPGVMARLGLDYATLAQRNPRLVYCSLSGYGQSGAQARRAGHDLSYLAGSGLLSLLTSAQGEPIVPGVLLADVAAGAYPAFANVVLALFARERSGRGAYLDIALARNLDPFTLGARAGKLFSGGSPRYRCYRTRDGAWLAVAALEAPFWREFCERVELDPALRDDARDPAATAAEVARLIAARDARDWNERLVPFDTCCALVAPLGVPATSIDLPLDPQLCVKE